MNPLLQSIILTILPISELRGGIPYAITKGINPLLAFIILVLANILIIPIIFLFLTFLHKYFYKIKIYRILFDKYVKSLRNKVQHKIGTKTEYWMLFLFVALPAPGTGAYTGTLIAWLFNLNRKKSFLVISLGVLTAGIIVTLLSLGFFSLF